MKKQILAALVLASLSLGATAQIGYPGSTWSELTISPSVIKGTAEDNNIVFQGAIQQGIDWAQYGNYKFNTFIGMGYIADKNHLSYNNKITPMIGARLIRTYGDAGTAEAGIRLVHQRNFRPGIGEPRSGTGIQAYAGYWFGWNLKK